MLQFPPETLQNGLPLCVVHYARCGIKRVGTTNIKLMKVNGKQTKKRLNLNHNTCPFSCTVSTGSVLTLFIEIFCIVQ